MKKLAVALIVVFAVAGIYVGAMAYEQHKFVELIRPHVKNSSLRLSNALRYEIEADTKITYKELFERLESDVAEIDKRILEVQTVATPGNKGTTDPVIAYMKGSQDLLRALLQKYRNVLTFNSALEWAHEKSDDLRTASYYSQDTARRSKDKAYEALLKVKTELDESRADVLSAATNMKATYAKVATELPPDALIDPAIFGAVAKENEPKQGDPR